MEQNLGLVRDWVDAVLALPRRWAGACSLHSGCCVLAITAALDGPREESPGLPTRAAPSASHPVWVVTTPVAWLVSKMGFSV